MYICYVGRFGRPEEVAGLVGFLAVHPAASYVTGQASSRTKRPGFPERDRDGVVSSRFHPVRYSSLQVLTIDGGLSI